MNPGGLNNFRDSFAPSPPVDVMWHISNPNTPPPRPKVVDSQKPAESDLESYLTEGKANKSLVIFMKSCKVFLYIAFGAPYLIFIKFPVALKRFSFPLIKKANKEVLDALKKNYAKISHALNKASEQISSLFNRLGQGISRFNQSAKLALSKQMDAAKAEIHRYLNPFLEMAVGMSRVTARLSVSSAEYASTLAAKLSTFKSKLKGFSVPKIFSENRNRMENAFSIANEGLKSAWKLAQESVEKAASLLAERLDAAKDQFSKIKDKATDQAKKLRKYADAAVEYVAKAISAVVNTAKEAFIQPMQTAAVLVQHPYHVALSLVSAARNVFEKSAQSVLQVLSDRIQLAKVVIANAGHAILLPFKRGFNFLKQQSQKVLNRMRQAGLNLVQKFYGQGQNAKKRLVESIKKLLAKCKVVYALFKRFLMRVFRGLKLFWTWAKLMSSFAAFLIKQLFREVLASLR